MALSVRSSSACMSATAVYACLPACLRVSNWSLVQVTIAIAAKGVGA